MKPSNFNNPSNRNPGQKQPQNQPTKGPSTQQNPGQNKGAPFNKPGQPQTGTGGGNKDWGGGSGGRF